MIEAWSEYVLDFVPDQIPMETRYTPGLDHMNPMSPYLAMHPYTAPVQDVWLYMLVGMDMLSRKECLSPGDKDKVNHCKAALESVLAAYLSSTPPCVFIPEENEVVPRLRQYVEDDDNTIILHEEHRVDEFKTKVLKPLVELLDD
jgi:hypothetical protein